MQQPHLGGSLPEWVPLGPQAAGSRAAHVRDPSAALRPLWVGLLVEPRGLSQASCGHVSARPLWLKEGGEQALWGCRGEACRVGPEGKGQLGQRLHASSILSLPVSWGQTSCPLCKSSLGAVPDWVGGHFPLLSAISI